MPKANLCEVRDVLCQHCPNNDEDQFDCTDLHSGEVQHIRCNRCKKDFCLPGGSWEALLAAHRAERANDLGSRVDQDATKSYLEYDFAVQDVQTRSSLEETVPSETTSPDLWGVLLMIPCKCGNRERFELITDPDGSLVARQCAECSDCTGVDATTAVEDILSLLEKDTLKTKPCAGCGNDDVNRFILAQGPQEGDIVLRCTCCDVINPLTMPDDDAFLDDIQRNGVRDQPGDGSAPYDTFSSGNLCRQCPECQEDVTDIHYEDINESKERLIRCGHCDCQLSSESLDIQCECGNADLTLFSVHMDSAQKPIALECLACSHLVIRENPQVEHDLGGNPDYPRGRDVSVVSPPIPDQLCASELRKGRREVTNLNQLRVGDHIAWHRPLGHWHHAVVSDVSHGNGNSLNVIQYDGPAKDERKKAVITESCVTVDLVKEDLYVFNYDKCLPTETVLERARSKLGESCYNLLASNCEHFATWAKTGVWRSGQVTSVVNTLKEHGFAFIKGMMPGAVASGGRWMLGRGVMTIGGLAVTVGLSEVKATVSDIHESYGKMKDGRISRKDFLKSTIRRACRGGVAIAGIIAGTLVGAFISIPLGALVGCFLGRFIGNALGAIIGRQAQKLAN